MDEPVDNMSISRFFLILLIWAIITIFNSIQRQKKPQKERSSSSARHYPQGERLKNIDDLETVLETWKEAWSFPPASSKKKEVVFNKSVENRSKNKEKPLYTERAYTTQAKKDEAKNLYQHALEQSSSKDNSLADTSSPFPYSYSFPECNEDYIQQSEVTDPSYKAQKNRPSSVSSASDSKGRAHSTIRHNKIFTKNILLAYEMLHLPVSLRKPRI